MSTAVFDLLQPLPRVHCVGQVALAALMDQQPLVLVLFTGLTNPRPEAFDVAVVVRELLQQHPTVHLALVTHDEAPLIQQFDVIVMPTLLWLVRGAPLERLTRIRDWGDYARVTQRCLAQLAAVVSP